MTSSREELLFHLALTKPEVERAAWLDRECAQDPALRARLDILLAAHARSETLLAGEPEPTGPTLPLDLSDAPDEAVGQTLGRYKLLERVGEGGCGVVYVAEQTHPVRRRVALKVIKLGMDTKQVVARFEAERQALAMMDHPNIAKVLDAGTTELGRPFFVMELVRGIKITDYCDQANLSTRDRLDLFIKVCQAIQHAHQKGIIHRDVKPSNILVTLHDGTPVPKVIDFGIAKATEGRLTDATVYTQLHQFIGTPAYMSPEQAEMSGLDIDTRSDIYSLGVLLYELLAGSTPFDARELMASGIDAMRRTIREKEPVRPSTRLATLGADQLTTTAKRRSADTAKLLHQLKGDLDWIVMKCLEKDRQRRYETANGLAADIRRHLDNEPVTARPPSTAYRFQKAFRRNKLVFAAGGAVVVALLLGALVSTWQAVRATRASEAESRQRLLAEQAQAEAQAKQREAEDERGRARQEQQRADAQARKAVENQEYSRRLLYATDMNLAQQAVNQNNVGRATRLLNRHRPGPGEQDLRGWEWRYLWQLTQSSALVTLTNRPARGSSLSFSPDGAHLAVGWDDGYTDLWDVPRRLRIRTLKSHRSPNTGKVVFAPTGNLLAATSDTNTVTLHDLDTGRESILWRVPSPDGWHIRDLSFSRDASKLVIYAGSMTRQGDEVWVVNVASSRIENRHRSTYSDSPFHGAARMSPDNRLLYLARSDALQYRYSIQCLDLATGEELWQTEVHEDYGLTALAISPDGRVLVSGSGFEDPTIRVWDAGSGRSLARLNGHTGWVAKLAFSADGRRLISAASDQTIRFWDAVQWTETRVLRGHTDEVHALAFSDTAQLVASAGKDGNLMLWTGDGSSASGGYRRLPWKLDAEQVRLLPPARALLLPPGAPPQWMDLEHDSDPVPLPASGSTPSLPIWTGTNLLCHWNGTNQFVVHELRGVDFVPRGTFTLDAGSQPVRVAYHPEHQLLGWTDGNSSNSVFLGNLAVPGRRTELKSATVCDTRIHRVA